MAAALLSSCSRNKKCCYFSSKRTNEVSKGLNNIAQIFSISMYMPINVRKSPCMHVQICSTNNEPCRRYFLSISINKKPCPFSPDRMHTSRKRPNSAHLLKTISISTYMNDTTMLLRSYACMHVDPDLLEYNDPS